MEKQKNKILLSIVFILIYAISLLGQYCSAQAISGTYYIGGGGSPAFANIQAAFTYLNSNGIAGPLTLNIAAGYTETAPNANGFQLGSTTLNSSLSYTNTLTIRKNGNGNNPIIVAATGGTSQASTIASPLNGILALSGVDFVTIDGINFIENTANTNSISCMEYGIGFFKLSNTDGCQNNTIKNCLIQLSLQNTAPGAAMFTNGSCGIWMANTKAINNVNVIVSSNSGSHSYNSITSNAIVKTQTAIYLNGYTDTIPSIALMDHDNTINGNYILQFGSSAANISAFGIRSTQQNQLIINGNTLINNDGSSSNHNDSLRGIYIDNPFESTCGIINNTIQLQSGNNSLYLRGIELLGISISQNNSILIQNNTLQNFRSNHVNADVSFVSTSIVSCGYLYLTNNTINYANLKSNTCSLIQIKSKVNYAININNNTIDSIQWNSNVCYGIYLMNNNNTDCVLDINTNSLSRIYAIKLSTSEIIGIHGDFNKINLQSNLIQGISFPANNISATLYAWSGKLSPSGSMLYQNESGYCSNISSYFDIKTSLETSNLIDISLSKWHDISSVGGSLQIVQISEPKAQIRFTSNTIAIIQSDAALKILAIQSQNPIYPILISQNSIKSIQAGTNQTLYGLYCQSDSAEFIVTKNIFTSFYGSTVIGIFISTHKNSLIAANKIGHFFANDIKCIYSDNQSLHILQNTIYLNNTGSNQIVNQSSLIHLHADFFNTAKHFIKGNILFSDIKPAISTNTSSLIRITNSDFSLLYTLSDYNWFYSDSVANDRPLFVSETNNIRQVILDISSLQHQSNGMFQHSFVQNALTYFKSVNPIASNYLSIDDSKANWAESASDTSGFTAFYNFMITDFDSEPRMGTTNYTGSGLHWDIGADEFNGTQLIPAIKPYISFNVPMRVCQNNIYNIPFQISSIYGISMSNVNQKPYLYYRINSLNWNVSNAVYISGDKYNSQWNASIQANNWNKGDTIWYFIVAEDSITNATPSLFPSYGSSASNTISIPIKPLLPYAFVVGNSMGGSYSIGKYGDFKTITKAAQSYMGSCVTKDVDFNLIDTFYSEQTGEIFPIEFNHSTVFLGPFHLRLTSQLSSEIHSDSSSIFQINGADNIHMGGNSNDFRLYIDTIPNANISIVNINSAGNPSKNLHFNGIEWHGPNLLNQTTAYNYFGISANAYTDSIIVSNNKFFNLNTAIYFGAGFNRINSAALSINISENYIDSSVSSIGIGVFNAYQPIIQKNQISIISNQVAEACGINTAFDVYHNNSSSYASQISFNQINGVSNTIGSSCGIFTSQGDINNNIVNRIFGSSDGMYNTYSTGIRVIDSSAIIRNNTIVLDGVLNSIFSAHKGYCLYLGARANVYNNILQNSISNVQAFGNINGLYFLNTSISKLGKSDFNLAYAPIMPFTNSYYFLNATNQYSTLISFQSATQNDSNSIQANPLLKPDYISIDSLSPAWQKANKSWTSDKDIFAHNRHPFKPCIGAYETDFLINTDSLPDLWICPGDSLSIKYQIYSGSKAQYTWYLNNQILINQQSPNLQIKNMTSADTGVYQLNIQNDNYSINTDPFYIHLLKPTRIQTILTNSPINAGDTLQMKVNATGEGLLQYTWYFNDSLLNGFNNSIVKIEDIRLNQAGNYKVSVQADCGMVWSDTIKVKVIPNHFLHVKNAFANKYTVCESSDFMLGLNAISDTTIQYQWYKNGVAIANQKQSILTITNSTFTDSGNYSVKVYTSYQTFFSDTFHLQVNLKTKITLNPISQYVSENDSAKFQVSATGYGNLTYAWYQKQTVLQSGSKNYFYIPKVNINDTGSYFVQVSGVCGTEYSPAFRLSLHYIKLSNTVDSLKYCKGSTRTFYVAAKSDEQLTYQWFKGNILINGATKDSLNIVFLDSNQIGNYYCKVSTIHVSKNSDAWFAEMYESPGIPLIQHNNRNRLNDTFIMSVTLNSNDSIQYQWYKNSVAISGANQAQLTIYNMTYSDAGIYKLAIITSCNTIFTSDTFISVKYLIINQSPQTAKTCMGLNAYFSVDASGSNSIIYQWFHNGMLVNAATNSNILISKVNYTDTGFYYLQLTNEYGTINSDTVHLNLFKETQISFLSPGYVANIGSNHDLFCYASGEGNLRYTWYKNNQVITNTSPVLSFHPISAMDSGYYKVKVSGLCNSLTSDSAWILPSLSANIFISKQPQNQKICAANPAELSVQAFANSNIHYQWKKNGTDLPNDTLPILSFKSIGSDDRANYTVMIQSDSGSVLSDNAVINMLDTIEVISFSKPQTITIFQPVNFNVNCNGSTPIHYQWLKNNNPIPENDSTVLLIPSVNLTDSGSYFVRVSNVCSDKIIGPMRLVVHDNRGVDEIDNLEVNVYPNPAKNILNINSLNSKPIKIEVWDIWGKCYFYSNAMHSKQEAINVDEWPEANYILRITYDHATIYKQISILH